MSFEDEKIQLQKEFKNNLITLRKSIVKSINSYNKKILLKQKELKNVNTQICSTFGHDFTTWEKHKREDKTYYYDRQCMICGIIDKTQNEPEEYITKDINGKVRLCKKLK